MSSNTTTESTDTGAPVSLGLMDSISPQCTPLKHKYDGCFNAWFQEYLGAATNAEAEQSAQSSGSWTKGIPRFSSSSQRITQKLTLLRERYEYDCGKLFTQYQACVQVRIK